jgi:hypothetical protein
MGRKSVLWLVLVQAAWGLAFLAVAGWGGPVASAITPPGVRDAACPSGAIPLEPGASIQAAVERAGDGAVFCLKSGVYRMQVVRPRSGQRFYGEAHTVLNGSRLLTTFSREGRFWVAGGQRQHGRKHGECAPDTPACSLPQAVFVDDNPLIQVLNKESVGPNQFYFGDAGERIYLADDPTDRKVAATVAAFAFDSTASDVLVSNISVEKYASVAQKRAITCQ